MPGTFHKPSDLNPPKKTVKQFYTVLHFTDEDIEAPTHMASQCTSGTFSFYRILQVLFLSEKTSLFTEIIKSMDTISL